MQSISEIKNDIFLLWKDLNDLIDWKKFRRSSINSKEKKILDKYCKKFSKQFIEKYRYHPEIDTTDYILKNFNSVRIKTNFPNICLLIPYEFISIFEDGAELQIDIHSILSHQSNDLTEIVYLIKDALQNVRKALRPKDIEILRALTHFSYPYFNSLPPPSSSEIAQRSRLKEETVRIYLQNYLVAKQFIYHYIIFNPWIFGYDLLIAKMDDLNITTRYYELWHQFIQNCHYSVLQIPNIREDSIVSENQHIVQKLYINYNLTGLRKNDADSFKQPLVLNTFVTDDPLIKMQNNFESSSLSELDYRILREYGLHGLVVKTSLTTSVVEEIATKLNVSSNTVYGTINNALEKGFIRYFPRIRHIGINCRYAILVQNSSEVVEQISQFLMQCPLSFHYIANGSAMFLMFLHQNQINSALIGIDRISRIDKNAIVKYSTYTIPESELKITINFDSFTTEYRLGSLIHV